MALPFCYGISRRNVLSTTHDRWKFSARCGSRRSARRRLCRRDFCERRSGAVWKPISVEVAEVAEVLWFFMVFILKKMPSISWCVEKMEKKTQKKNKLVDKLMSYAWWFWKEKKTFFRRFADLSNAFWKFQDKPCVNVSYVMCNTNPKKDRDVTRAVGWKSSLLTMSVRKKWKWGQIHSSALGRGNRSMAGLCCTWIHSCHKSWRPRMNCMNHESTLTCWIWQHESKS